MTTTDDESVQAILPVQENTNPHDPRPKAIASFDDITVLLDNDVHGDGTDMAANFVQQHPTGLAKPVIIRLQPGKSIPTERDSNFGVIGNVLECEADELTITYNDAKTVTLKSFDDFVIPPGTKYSMTNHSSTEEATIKFLINL
jgi:hypothetical protein